MHLDGFGVQGNLMHFGIVVSLVGGAFFLFLYFWSKGRLDMDEEPKIQMMEEDE